MRSLPVSSNVSLTHQSGDIHRRKQYDGLQALAGDPIELCPGFSAEDAEVLILAVYRQVLGNAYVMESERLQIPESQLKQGNLSVREFIRCIAKSALYRSRFVDNCYRYRSIELNFKHFLGRAPISFEEMKYHSKILDESGFEADIDSYLDSDEYQKTFGENLVPYYRGYKTQIGQSLIGFTNTLQLLRSASSSDKDLASSNAPQLTRAIILNRPYGIDRPRDAEDILRDVFKSKTSIVDRQQQIQRSAERNAAEQVLTQTLQKQSQEIERLQQRLADLRPVAMMGANQLKDDWGLSTLPKISDEASSSLQQRVDFQAAHIVALQVQVSDARRYEMIGEFQLNKWRNRIFKG
ncbi:MAG: phycobilisome rod-core linker polypeptide [Cyanobacteria bacterium]|nr:phycobilisome rod-core linker polypeptide [Cyanobacteriota bacterium]